MACVQQRHTWLCSSGQACGSLLLSAFALWPKPVSIRMPRKERDGLPALAACEAVPIWAYRVERPTRVVPGGHNRREIQRPPSLNADTRSDRGQHGRCRPRRPAYDSVRRAECSRLAAPAMVWQLRKHNNHTSSTAHQMVRQANKLLHWVDRAPPACSSTCFDIADDGRRQLQLLPRRTGPMQWTLMQP